MYPLEQKYKLRIGPIYCIKSPGSLHVLQHNQYSRTRGELVGQADRERDYELRRLRKLIGRADRERERKRDRDKKGEEKGEGKREQKV